MKRTEKMSYLQGLISGLDIDSSTKEGKVILQMAEVMEEMVLYVDDLQSQVDELTELCDALDEDLGSVEDVLCEDDDDDYKCMNCGEQDECDEDEDEEDDEDEDYGFDEDDDELYEVTCPSCGDTILLDEGMIEEGTIHCPNCNELLEFDYDGLTIEDFEGNEEDEKSDDKK